MYIRKAVSTDIDEIECLYNDLNDYLAQNVNYPGWRRDVYPIRQNAEDGFNEQALYVVLEDERIVGTFILRHRPEPAYNEVDWKNDFSYEEIYVIYTLAVHLSYLKHHIGDIIMEYIISLAEKEKMKAIRLDVYENNVPAIGLYEKHGFEYIDTVDLGYSEYGLDYFKLYQYIVKN